MGGVLGGLLDNDSRFGRLMTRLGILIASNIMFVIFCLPLITCGASLTALFHVMLRTLRSDGEINPIKEFWKGFKTNFKQSTICWAILMVIAAILYFDVRILMQASGGITYVRPFVIAIALITGVLFIFLFMTMAMFEDTIKNLMRNALFFALKKPFKTIVIAFFYGLSTYLTYTDPQMLPLYGFIWVTCGYSLLAMLASALTLPLAKPYLPLVDSAGDFIFDDDGNKIMPGSNVITEESFSEPTEAEVLEMMKKMGM